MTARVARYFCGWLWKLVVVVYGVAVFVIVNCGINRLALRVHTTTLAVASLCHFVALLVLHQTVWHSRHGISWPRDVFAVLVPE